MDFISKAIIFFQEHRFLFTILILFILILGRILLISLIRHDSRFISDHQRTWISRTKNWTSVLMLVTVFYIWKTEINQFALSLTAITFALVVASKEIILCMTGSFHRASSGSFTVGEWIEVGNYTGEVIDHNIMATQIQEIDVKSGSYAYTGKVITLPNSIFFTSPVKNLYFMKRYVYHEFQIVTKENVNLFPLLPPLIEKIDEHCEDFSDVATRYNHMIERHVGIDLPGSDPLVTVNSSSFGDPIIHVRIFCPTERALELEQLIKKDFMTLYDEYILEKETIEISNERDQEELEN